MRRAKNANFRVLEGFAGFAPGWRGIGMLLLMMGFGAILGSIAAYPIMRLLGSDAGMEYATMIVYPLQFVPALIWAASRSSAELTRVQPRTIALDRDGFSPVGGFGCALLVVIVIFACSLATDPITSWLPEMPARLKAALESMVGGNIWVNLFCVAVMAPVFEEWLCRGMVLRGLLARGKKPSLAIGVSALFFAVIHLNPWQAIPAFIIGCLMGYVYYKTGSLKLTMLMHCVNNASAVLLARVPGLEDMETWRDVIPSPQYWFIIAGCLLLIALVILMFKRVEAPSWKRS